MCQVSLLVSSCHSEDILNGFEQATTKEGFPMATRSNPVLTMLKADHKKVKALFVQFEDATARKRQDIVQTTIQELEVHAEWKKDSSILRFEQGSKMTR
jgi:hypothetical protein